MKRLSPNFQGVAWMIMGMLGFAIMDVLLKLLAGAIPTGQILIWQGLGGVVIFLLMGRRTVLEDWRSKFLHPVVLWRNLAEVLAAVGFVTALATASLSTIAAIIQSNPLLVTLGAALFLREPVGPMRWSAILIGLCGVLIVIRPGGETFEPAALYALGAVICLSIRDLLTRWVPNNIPTVQLGSFAMLSLTFVGILIQLTIGETLHVPTPSQWIYLLGTILLLPVGIYGTTAAMRVGEMSVVTPFRYTRLVFALILAALIFGETPDALTYLGAAIIVAAGLFTLWRERLAST